jgi:hypothetical protein
MTNFKNPFASIKYCSHQKSSSRAYHSRKKSFGTKALISLILLLGMCCNFALTALAQGGMAAAGASVTSINPTGNPMGPSPSKSGSMAAAGASAGSNSSPASANNMAAAGASVGSTPPPASINSMAAAGASVGPTNLVVQTAELKANSFTWLTDLMNWYGGTNTTESNIVTQGIQSFWKNTGQPFLTNLGNLVNQWVKQIVMFIIEPIVQLLTGVLVQFAYNPDVSVGTDQFSTNVQDLAMWVRYLSNDLLLLFFILSIWRYWANAAWKGGSMMGAVARIIVAASATTAWPTIYHYVILISNALTQYLMNQNVLNATTISNAVATAITNIVNPISPNNAAFSFADSILSSGNISFSTGLAAPIILIAQLLLVAAIGLAIIGSIVVFFTMKVIQIVIVVAAFVFAPFFLCLLVSPDTDSVVSGFIRSFVETCLWTFVWTIFLMLFIIALNVDPSGANANGLLTVTQNPQNPWFVLFLELGILQAMIQTPGYLSRGKISEAGEFLEIYGLWKLGKGAGNMLFGPDGYASKAFRYAKRSPYNPLRSDNAKMSLGGEGAFTLASGVEGSKKQLKSLNDYKNRGAEKAAGFVPGAFAGVTMAGLGRSAAAGQSPVAAALARSQASANAAMGMGGSHNLGGLPSSDVPGSSGYESSPALEAIRAASRSSLSQFGTSVGGSYRDGPNVTADGAPLVQKTSLAQLGTGKNNPWHDMRGRRTSALDCGTMFNLNKVRTGSVDLKESKNNENVIHFDDAGDIKKLEHRKAASPEEIGMLNTVAGLATIPYSDGKGRPDARAVSATNNSVKNAGKWDAPLGRRISYALANGRVPEYVRNLEKDRLEREKVKARIVGSMAYANGEKGNAYTEFLEWKFGGKMDDGTRAMIGYTSTNTDAGLSGFNLNWEHGITRLGRMGLDINPATMGIASHEGIIAMKPSEQPQAIPAALQLMNAHLEHIGITPSSKEWNGPLHFAAADGVLRGMTSQHMRAAHAISNIAGIQAVTPQYVNKILGKHTQSGQGQMAHAYERVVLEDLGRIQPPLNTGRSSRRA